MSGEGCTEWTENKGNKREGEFKGTRREVQPEIQTRRPKERHTYDAEEDHTEGDRRTFLGQQPSKVLRRFIREDGCRGNYSRTLLSTLSAYQSHLRLVAPSLTELLSQHVWGLFQLGRWRLVVARICILTRSCDDADAAGPHFENFENVLGSHIENHNSVNPMPSAWSFSNGPNK